MFLLNGNPEQPLPPSWELQTPARPGQFCAPGGMRCPQEMATGGFYSGAGSAVLTRMIKPGGVGHTKIWPRVGATPRSFVGKFRMYVDGSISLPCRVFHVQTQTCCFVGVLKGFWGLGGAGLFLEEIF